jgi:predicted nucleotidyltransferase
MPSRPTRQQIADQDRYQLVRYAAFPRAADEVTAAFVSFGEVRAVKLFGSVARPLAREVPRFQPFRRLGIEILRECSDVDLAVWLDRLDNLSALNRARNLAATTLQREPVHGVPHHQVDVFLFDRGWSDYAGRLCTYGQCPKDKVECLTPRCGSQPFLRQHRDFVFRTDALADDRSVLLYERGRGIVCRAGDLGEEFTPGRGSSVDKTREGNAG